MPTPDKNSEFLVSLLETIETTNSQERIQWPLLTREDFMRRRCDLARKNLKDRLRKSARGAHGFVAVLPLYNSDFRKPVGLLRRPTVFDVKSPLFEKFADEVFELGLDCFIERPGKDGVDNGLSDVGMEGLDEQYLSDCGEKTETNGDIWRHSPPGFYWALYVLLPGKAKPRFSIFHEISWKFSFWCADNFTR